MDITGCTHCHICRDSCAFLKKYNMDIGDGDKLRELAYHCFLCGKCSSVCPEGIDGRGAVLELRRERAEDGSAPIDDKGYRALLWEKRDYRFRNYRHASEGSVLFPGCNFASFYPETMKRLEAILKEEAGIGTVYDCCGKPIAELGLKADEDRIIDELNSRIKEHGISELIMVCPNCYHYMKGRINCRITSVYDKLDELGLGEKIPGGKVFMPCPERDKGEMLESLKKFFTGDVEIKEGPQCCGLGGSAGVAEPGIARSMASSFTEDEIYVYCASCAGNFTRGGSTDTVHVLAEILGTHEKPAVRTSALNRALTRIK